MYFIVQSTKAFKKLDTDKKKAELEKVKMKYGLSEENQS